MKRAGHARKDFDLTRRSVVPARGVMVDAKTDVDKRYNPSSITRSHRKLPA